MGDYYMKTSITLLVLFLFVGSALAQGGGQPVLEPNSLTLVAGDPELLYPDESYSCFYGTEYAELYLIIVNPWNMNTNEAITTIGGFECTIDLPEEVVMLMMSTYAAGSINFLPPPQYLVGSNIPVTGPQALLASLVVYIADDPTDNTWGAMVRPVESRYQSIEGFAAITDLNDEYSLSAAVSAGGEYDEAVF